VFGPAKKPVGQRHGNHEEWYANILQVFVVHTIKIWCIILADEKQEKNLKIVMLDINMMEILFKIFKLNVRTISPDKFVFDPVIHAHKVVS
jgi:hypothetical protein